jgi:hypothetical protein
MEIVLRIIPCATNGEATDGEHGHLGELVAKSGLSVLGKCRGWPRGCSSMTDELLSTLLLIVITGIALCLLYQIVIPFSSKFVAHEV